MTQQEKDERYMRMALDEAQAGYGTGRNTHRGSCRLQESIVARAHNLTETLTDPTAHAEVQAITSACNELGGKYLSDCTLYVTVEPCPMCAGALGWAQISRVVYGCSDPKRGFHSMHRAPCTLKTQTTGSILEEECRLLMQDFFKNRR